MANLSLARIMYGTNEDFHASSAMSEPQFASFAAQTVSSNLAKSTNASEPATLSELLHKVWSKLTTKH